MCINIDINDVILEFSYGGGSTNQIFSQIMVNTVIRIVFNFDLELLCVATVYLYVLTINGCYLWSCDIFVILYVYHDIIHITQR